MASTLPDLAPLLPSWQLAMRAERKSPGTIKTYSDGVAAFLRWCEATGTPAELTKSAVQAFIADLLDNGAQATTAQARQLAVRRFTAWLVDEGELDADPLLGMKQPKLDRKVVQALTDDELTRIIKACNGKNLKDRRDEAIVRLMGETGLRAGEVIGLQTTDVDLQTRPHDGHQRQGRQGPGCPVQPTDGHGNRPLYARAAFTPARRCWAAVGGRWR